MKYLLMIYCDEAADSARPEADLKAEMDAYFAYTNEVQGSGALAGGEALHPSSTATTIRLRDGRLITTDGPFAESKEQLGGYYLVNCANLDEAIQWASKIPHASRSAIEIRPVMDFSQSAGV